MRHYLAYSWLWACLAGCGAGDGVGLSARVTLAQGLTLQDFKSYRIYVVPRAYNGVTVDCESFFRGTVQNNKIPLLATGVYANTPGEARVLEKIPPASDLLVFVDAYDQANGDGVVVGRGCSEHIDVVARETTNVQVLLKPWPAP